MMRHRNYMAIGGFALALLSTSALATYAFAENESMQPISGWSSTSVTNKGTASYCAVARRFDGNVILTLARNKRDETSLALDFDKGGFEKGNLFHISLDPGAGQQRTMSVKPASGKAFVFKLGKDEKFYQALTKTGFLRTEIGEHGYNFNLADIGSGKESLSTCLSQIGTPVAQADAQPVQMAAITNDSDKLDELSERLARLERENNRLRNSAPALAQVNVPADPLKAGMTPELPLERVPLKPLNTPLDLASAPLEPVIPPLSVKGSGSLGTLHPRTPSQMASNTLPTFSQTEGSVAKVDQSLLVSLAAENRKLKEQLDRTSASAQPEELAELSVRLKTLEKQNKNLSEKLQGSETRLALASTNARISEKDSKTIAQLKSENDRLVESLAALQTAAGEEESAAAAKKDLEEKLSVLELENKKLNHQIDTLLGQNGDYAGKIAGYEARVASLEKELAKKEEGPDYASLIETLKLEVAEAKTQVEALKQDVADTKSENASLKAEVADTNTQNDELKLKIEEARASNESLQQKVADAQSEAQALKAKSAQGADSFKGEVAALKGQMENISAEKDALAVKMKSIQEQAAKIAGLEEKTKAKEEEVADLRLTLETLKTENISLKTENTSLKQASVDEKAKGAQASLSLADTQDKLEQLTLENEGMRENIKQLEGSKSDIEALKSANMELASLLDEAGDLSQAQEESLAEQQKKIDELTRQLEEGGSKEVVALNKQIKALDEENKALKEELGVAQIELISLKQDAGAEISQAMESALGDVSGQSKIETAGAEPESMDNSGALDITEGGSVVATAQKSDAAEDEMAEDLSLDEPLQTAKTDTSEDTLKMAGVESVAAEAPRSPEVKPPIPFYKPPHKSTVLAKAEPAKAADPRVAEDIQAAEAARVAAVEPASGGQEGVEPERLLAMQQEQMKTAGLSEAQRQEMALANEVSTRPVVEPNADRGAKVYISGVADAPVAAAEPTSSIQTEDLAEDMVQAAEGPKDDALASISDESRPEDAGKEASSALNSPTTPADKAVAKTEFSPSLPIEKILTAARIPVDGTVKLLADMSGPNFYAYQWKSQGGLFGSAQQKPVHNEAEFDGLVQDYLTKTEQRCKGDFAIDPSSTQEAGGTRIDSYEIACVGGTGATDSSASLLFFEQAGTFTVVAHESPTAGMSTAMDYRDRLIESLKKS